MILVVGEEKNAPTTVERPINIITDMITHNVMNLLLLLQTTADIID